MYRGHPYLPLVEERLLGLGGLDGLVGLPLLQQVLRHQRDPPPRPAGREKPFTSSRTARHRSPPHCPDRPPRPPPQPRSPPGWQRIRGHCPAPLTLLPPSRPGAGAAAAHAPGRGARPDGAEQASAGRGGRAFVVRAMMCQREESARRWPVSDSPESKTRTPSREYLETRHLLRLASNIPKDAGAVE